MSPRAPAFMHAAAPPLPGVRAAPHALRALGARRAAAPLSLGAAAAPLPLGAAAAPPRRARRCRVPRAPTCAADAPGDGEVPFEIRGFSLANVGLALGGAITLYSFSSYFGSNATASATSLGFVYGVPILLIGCALKYAELQPVRVSGAPDARAARDAVATDVQRKIYSDITRHRYGDEAHLSAALAALGLQARGEACPELVRGEESVGERGEYRLRLVFYSGATPWGEWKGKVDRFERFFGPGVSARVEKVDAEKRLVALTLSSVQGRAPPRAE